MDVYVRQQRATDHQSRSLILVAYVGWNTAKDQKLSSKLPVVVDENLRAQHEVQILNMHNAGVWFKTLKNCVEDKWPSK